MKILVCISHVPDTTARIAFTDNNTAFDKTGVQYIIGPYEDFALARAVELKEECGAAVTVLCVGGAETEATIRKALAIGADDAVRIDSEPTSASSVATQIAHYVKESNFDLILMGRESTDYNGGVVHTMVGGLLGLPAITPVMTLEIEGSLARISREIDGGREFMEVQMPFVAGCQEPIAEWKIPNMRGIMTARTKPLVVKERVETDSGVNTVSYSLPEKKSGVKLVDEDNMDELAALLKNEAKVL